MIYSTQYVRHDSWFCMIPGLFTPSMRNKKREALDVQREYDGYNLHFMGYKQLCGDDLRLLQVITALSGINGKELGPKPESKKGVEVRSLLDLRKEALTLDSILISTSFYELIKEAGWVKGRNKYLQIDDSLKRLNNVTLRVTKDSKWWSSSLVGASSGDEKGERLSIALNPKVAQIVLNLKNTENVTYIDMSEVRSKMNEATRILHQFLSAWIGPGRMQKIGVEKMVMHIWPRPCLPTTMRDRKAKVRKSMQRLNEFESWTVIEIKKDIFEIKRSRFAPWKDEEIEVS